MLALLLQPGAPTLWTPAGGGPPILTTLVLEGDSIAAPAGSFAQAYDAYRTDKAITVTAVSSRTVGAAANYNDGSNTMSGQVSGDLGFAPQLVAAMIGANDMAGAGTAAAYKTNLIALNARYRAAGVKFAWSPPLPYNSDGSHPSYTNFTNQRALLMADARDPAVWGQWATFYIPLGECIDFAGSNSVLFGDGIHPNQAGQDLLLPIFKAAMDSILDAGRTTSTQMYPAAWLANETSLATSTQITRKFVVAGLAHGGLALTGGNALAATNDAELRLNGAGSWQAAKTGWLYNGDTVELRLTTSASNSTAFATALTVGTETRTLSYNTGAAVAAVAYEHGGIDNLAHGGAGARSFGSKTFAADGLALICLNTDSGAGATAVSVGGAAATQLTSLGGYKIEVWAVAVTAGSRNVTVTQPGFQQLAMSWGVVTGADATPTAISIANPGGESNPHLTSSLTVPASGLMLGFMQQIEASAVNGTTVTGTHVAAGIGAPSNSLSAGIIIGKRTTTGAIGFTANTGFGDYGRLALVFKAAGT